MAEDRDGNQKAQHDFPIFTTKLKQKLSIPDAQQVQQNIQSFLSSNEYLSQQNSIKKTDIAVAALSLIGLIIACVDNQLYFNSNKNHLQNPQSDAINLVLRSIVSGFAGITGNLSAQLFLRYNSFFNHQTQLDSVFDTVKQNRNFKKYHYLNFLLINTLGSFLKSNAFKTMIIQILIQIVVIPPGIDYSIQTQGLFKRKISSPITDLILICMLSRLYLVFKLFGYYTFWRSTYAKYSCDTNGCNSTTWFAIKANFKKHSLRTMSINLCISSLLLSYCIRIVQRPYYYSQPQLVGTSDFSDIGNFWNSTWLSLITFTTVGYGDFFGKTIWGRFMSALGCIWGTSIISQMIVVFSNSSEFNPSQMRAYKLMRRMVLKQRVRNTAQCLIGTALLIRIYRNKKDPKLKQKIAAMAKRLQTLRITFKMVRRKMDLRLEFPLDQLVRQLIENIHLNIKQLHSQVQKMQDVMNNLKKIREYQQLAFHNLKTTKINVKKIQTILQTLGNKLNDRFNDPGMNLLQKEVNDYSQYLSVQRQ